MPRPIRLTTAADELALVRRALDAGFCTQADLAAHLRNGNGRPVSRPTLTLWLTKKRAPPAGLFFGLLRCLPPARRRIVLRWLVDAEAPESGCSVVDLVTYRRLEKEKAAAERLAEACIGFLTTHRKAA